MRPLIAVLAVAAAPAARADEVDDFVRGELARQKAPGLALAVVHNGEVKKARGYGLANVEHDVPVKRETVFQSGSVGKQFTATAVMLLVEDGKLELDDPVSKYLAGAPESWKDVTVRHLLTHTGGIREYTGRLNLQQNYTEDELLAKAFAFPTEFPPGTKHAYSNTGYAVLGILVSKVAGKFYGDFLKERVFESLGMKTARIISESDIVPNRAAGYQLVGGKLQNQGWVAPRTNTTGDGSLYLTVDDFIKWDAALSAGKVLKKASLDEMGTPARTSDGKEHPYGFGWQLVPVNGHKRIHHGGAWQGFTATIDRYVDDKLTVVVMMNLGAPNGNPGRVARGVAGLYVPELAAKKK
jgi:CubicO group peptidase (beta-lactamase class C family)